MSNAAAHLPESPWTSPGRFGDGSYKTLYLAESARGAMAEYLRRFPEFLQLQEDLNITIYEVEVSFACDCLDLRNAEQAEAVKFPPQRLVSSETDETLRYAECRLLAAEALTAGFCGLLYPSAAASWSTWNLVCFGDNGAVGGWRAGPSRPVERPVLRGNEVVVLSS